MIKDLFIKSIIENSPERIVSLWLFNKVPYIFDDDIYKYVLWKHTLSEKLRIDPDSIIFTGSSAIGISLSPYKNFKEFSDDSDIDIAIISEYHFIESWRFLRSIGSKYHMYSPKEKQAIRDHIERLIYWGTIATDKILHLLPFGKEWNEVVNKIKENEPIKGKDIKFRIYRDIESLRAYHANNIKALQSAELEKGDK